MNFISLQPTKAFFSMTKEPNAGSSRLVMFANLISFNSKIVLPDKILDDENCDVKIDIEPVIHQINDIGYMLYTPSVKSEKYVKKDSISIYLKLMLEDYVKISETSFSNANFDGMSLASPDLRMDEKTGYAAWDKSQIGYHARISEVELTFMRQWDR